MLNRAGNGCLFVSEYVCYCTCIVCRYTSVIVVRSLFTHQWDGNTALHMAAMDYEDNQHTKERRVKCVRALLSHPGIDVSIKNKEGRTAMKVHVSVCIACSVLVHIPVCTCIYYPT